MLNILDYLKLGAGMAVGVAAMLLLNTFVRDPLIRAEARKGYVLEAQVTALEAQLAEKQRQLAAGQKAAGEYQVQLQTARVEEQTRAEQVEKEIADYEKKLAEAGRACVLDGDDIDWLSK